MEEVLQATKSQTDRVTYERDNLQNRLSELKDEIIGNEMKLRQYDDIIQSFKVQVWNYVK